MSNTGKPKSGKGVRGACRGCHRAIGDCATWCSANRVGRMALPLDSDLAGMKAREAPKLFATREEIIAHGLAENAALHALRTVRDRERLPKPEPKAEAAKPAQTSSSMLASILKASIFKQMDQEIARSFQGLADNPLLAPPSGARFADHARYSVEYRGDFSAEHPFGDGAANVVADHQARLQREVHTGLRLDHRGGNYVMTFEMHGVHMGTRYGLDASEVERRGFEALREGALSFLKGLRNQFEPKPERAPRRFTERGSGRTYRQLEEAVARARRGERIHYVVHTEAMAGHAMAILRQHFSDGADITGAFTVMYGFADLHVVVVRHGHHKERLSGLTGVVYDHAWTEEFAKRNVGANVEEFIQATRYVVRRDLELGGGKSRTTLELSDGSVLTLSNYRGTMIEVGERMTDERVTRIIAASDSGTWGER